MNNLEQKLHTLSREINSAYVLKKVERSRMLEHVIQHGHTKEVIASPYHVVRFPAIFFMNKASMALLVTFLFTGVLSYAAEKALPGDPLYAVKTQFNENLQSLLTFSPESKAKLEAALAEKRLVEAQKLADSSRLTPDSEDQIQQSFNQHSDEFKKSVQELSVGNPGTAVSLSSDFQSALEVHESALKSLSANASTSDSGVANDLSKTIGDVDVLRKQAEDSLALLSFDKIKILVVQKRIEVSSAFNDIGIDVDATSSQATSSSEHITTALAVTAQGDAALKDTKYTEAFIYFQTALREIQKAELDAQAIVTDPSDAIDNTTASSTATSTIDTSITTGDASSTPATSTNPVQ